MIDTVCNINYIVVVMTKPASLGEFEQIVLLAILRLDKDAYGVTIRSEIIRCTGREPTPGALYTTLDRMEEKGIVRSWLGEATPQRGGRAKRYFALTKTGHAALVSAQEAYRNLLDGLNILRGAHACSFII
jgi:DNA-binding PadR family transcriptional regulator